MSFVSFERSGILLGIATILAVGCSAPANQDVPAGGSDGMPPWHPPRSGMTGTPADDVTDAVLDDSGLIALLEERPGASEGLRGTGIGEGGTIIYHAEDISFPGLRGLDLRPRGGM